MMPWECLSEEQKLDRLLRNRRVLSELAKCTQCGRFDGVLHALDCEINQRQDISEVQCATRTGQ